MQSEVGIQVGIDAFEVCGEGEPGREPKGSGKGMPSCSRSTLSSLSITILSIHMFSEI